MEGEAQRHLELGENELRDEPTYACFERALPHFVRAATMHSAQAQYNLGCMYARGDGVAQDDATSARYFEAAAAQGVPEACYNSGLACYAAGDYERALAHFERAPGMSSAMLNAGAMYETGLGAEADLARAYECFVKAADLGHASAQVKAARMLAAGTGVAVNAAEAQRYFCLAAAQGDREAMERAEVL